jgi:hypothetical protein
MMKDLARSEERESQQAAGTIEVRGRTSVGRAPTAALAHVLEVGLAARVVHGRCIRDSLVISFAKVDGKDFVRNVAGAGRETELLLEAAKRVAADYEARDVAGERVDLARNSGASEIRGGGCEEGSCRLS